VLSNTMAGQTIRFADNLSTAALTTTGNAYHLALVGDSTRVSGVTTFLNTGSLTLGNAANDSLAFDGGLVATAPSGLSLGGTVATTNTAMILGDNDTALVLNDHLSLTTAGGALAIHGAVNGSTANTQSLTLNAGASGLVDVTGAIGQSTSLKTLTLAHSNGAVFNAPVTTGTEVLLSNTTAGQTIRFADDLSTAALNTTANAYHLALVGGSTRVSGATTFLNTGILTLGNAANDSLAFDGGLVAVAPSGLSLGGTVGTTNTAMVLGDNDTALVLNDHLTLSTAHGALIINGAVNGTTANTQSLTLNAGTSGLVDVTGAIGQSRSLKTLTLTQSNGATFQAPVKADTAVVLSNTTAGQTIRFADNLSTASLTTTGNAYHLALVGDSTHVSGATTFLNTGSLTLGNAANDSLAFDGGLVATAPSGLSLGGTVGTTNTAMILGDNDTALVLNNRLTLTTGHAALNLDGAVSGAHELILNSTGATTFTKAVDATSITTNAGGTVVIQGGRITTTGAQSFGEDVFLDNSVAANGNPARTTVLNTSNGNVTFSGKLNNFTAGTVEHLTVNSGSGAVMFAETIGDTGKLGNLNINSTGATTFTKAVDATTITTNAGGTVVIKGGRISTTGAQSFGEDVFLDNSVAANGNPVRTTVLNTSNGNVTFSGKLNNFTAGTAEDLTLNTAAGAVLFAETIGDTGKLGNLNINSTDATTFTKAVDATTITTNVGGTVVIQGGRITTTGAQSFGEDVFLENSVAANGNPVRTTVLNTSNGNVTFSGKLNNFTAGTAEDLTLNTAAGAVLFAETIGDTGKLGNLNINSTGATTFTKAVDATTITTNVGGTVVIQGGRITTTVAQSYGEEATLGANTTLASTAAGNIRFANTLNGAYTLAIDTTGDTIFGGAVGNSAALASLTTNAGGNVEFNGGSLKTSGAQSYGEATILGANTTLASTAAGNIRFANTLNGAYTLAIDTSGDTIFGGAVGNSAALASLTTNAGGNVEINGGSVNTSGAQSYGEATILGANTTLASTAAGNIRFANTLNGAYTLAIDTTGDTIFGGAVGNSAALASLTTNAGGNVEINGGSVNTTGAQSYGEATILGANTTLASTAAGNIRFANTLNGAYTLAIDTTGDTIFGGAVGNSAALASLTTNAGGNVEINGGSVNTTGAQSYGEATILGANTTLASTAAGNIRFANTLNGAYTLAIDTTGDTIFGGAVGNSAALASLTTNAGGNVEINGGSVNTSGAQSYGEATILGANTTLASTAAGNIRFANTLNGAYTLAIDTTGDTIFGGAVGNSAALASFTTNAGGNVEFNGGSLKTSGAQSYGEATILGANTTLASTAAGNIRFANTLNGAYTLAIDTTGDTIFGGAVGNSAALSSIDLTGDLRANGASVSSTGLQTYSGLVTLGRDASFTSSQNTVNFLRITDAGATHSLELNSFNALALGNVDIAGDFHATTILSRNAADTNPKTAITQQANTTITIGGTTTFTADTGLSQVANLSNAGNVFTGILKFDEANLGSWNDISVSSASALRLASLQSGGNITLNTLGALITDSVTASGNLQVNSHGSAVTLGATILRGNLDLQTNGGEVRAGQLVVNGTSSVAAGAGNVFLDNPNNVFGDALSVQGHITAVATSTNLRLGSVQNTGPMSLRAPKGSIDLGTAFIVGGDLTLESFGDMNLGGANITGNLNMRSTAGDVSFGDASVRGNLTAATQGGVVDLGNAQVGGNLDVQTQGGNIVQSTAPGAALAVTGATRLSAGTGNIALPNVPNRFAGAVTLDAKDVVLTATGGLNLTASNVSGSLALTAVTGSITQSGPLTVAGVSQISALQGDVILDQANQFAQSLALNAINATVQSATGLQLGESTLTGQFTATVAQGDLTQTGALKVSGTSKLNTPAGNIQLTNADNLFGDKVDVKTSGQLSLTSADSLTLGTVDVKGDSLLQSQGKLDLGTGTFNGKLKANSGGFEITQTGKINFFGNTDFDAGSAKIDLFNPYNQWRGAILFKGGIILINHPVLMNAVNAGTLIMRAETSMPAQTAVVQVGGGKPSMLQPLAATPRLGPAVSVKVDQPSASNGKGLITVALSTETAAPGRSFSFEIDPKVLTNQPADTSLKVSQLDGKPLPDWLRYEADTKTFTAKDIPAGAFPLQLKVGVGGQETTMVIQEQDTKR
jgi:hypothetical protein